MRDQEAGVCRPRGHFKRGLDSIHLKASCRKRVATSTTIAAACFATRAALHACHAQPQRPLHRAGMCACGWVWVCLCGRGKTGLHRLQAVTEVRRSSDEKVVDGGARHNQPHLHHPSKHMSKTSHNHTSTTPASNSLSPSSQTSLRRRSSRGAAALTVLRKLPAVGNDSAELLSGSWSCLASSASMPRMPAINSLHSACVHVTPVLSLSSRYTLTSSEPAAGSPPAISPHHRQIPFTLPQHQSGDTTRGTVATRCRRALINLPQSVLWRLEGWTQLELPEE